ncbi:retrovirus-related pol polyprotein from transposon TNT 1-94 [Tanacetum coccineum]
MSDPTSKPSDALPVKIKAPKELPKISLVNESLKKLKFHLAKFDNVVKIRTTPNARTEGKEIVDIDAQMPSVSTIVPGMYKLDLEPLAPSAKKVVVTHKNKVKKVGFVEPLTSSSNIQQVESSKKLDSNTPVLTSTGLKCSISKYGSKPTGHTKNDRISRPTSRNMKNKVEAQPRKVNKKNRVVEPICDDNIKYSKLNANSDLNCATCKKSLFDDVHDKRLLDFVKNVNSSSKTTKIVESKNANHSEPNNTWGSNATDIPSSSSLVMIVRFGNDHIARIMGYGDFQLGNVTISRITRHKYIISLEDMLRTSLICLLSKASKTKSWLWHRQLSHLNFDTINKLAKNGLARSIPRLKFQKDHLRSACAFGKSKKSSHQPKADDTNQEKLYLLHMDLCVTMRVASINGKRYILVIVDDYSRFTWVRFLRTKDEAPEAIIKCIKNIQVRLNATDKKPDLSFFHVFGALCYPTNDNDDLGKLDAKADIDLADSPVSTSVDHDAPSSSTPSTQEQEQSPNISQGFEELPKTPIFCDDPLNESPHEE